MKSSNITDYYNQGFPMCNVSCNVEYGQNKQLRIRTKNGILEFPVLDAIKSSDCISPVIKNDIVLFNAITSKNELALIAIKVDLFFQMQDFLFDMCQDFNSSIFGIKPEALNLKSIRISLFGLTSEEANKIDNYIKLHQFAADTIEEPLFIKRGTEDLPRSLVCLPSGQHQGWHVLLKTHGGVRQVGIGAYNTVTFAFDFERKELKVLRSAKECDVDKSELYLNYVLKDYPDLFATGVPFSYRGPYRSRRGRPERVFDKSVYARERNVSKIGLIMDYFINGDLHSQINTANLKQKVFMMMKIAKGLDVLHKLGYTHRDFKLANILVDKNLNPKISDYGMACKSGVAVEAVASFGLISPEMIIAEYTINIYYANPKADIWALGVSMLALLTGDLWREHFKVWDERIKECREDPNVGIDNFEIILSNDLHKIIKSVFKNIISGKVNFKPKSIEDFKILQLIEGCLQPSPDLRLKAGDVAQGMFQIFNSMK